MNSTQKDLLGITLIALCVRLMAAWPQTGPNYMDAAYYTLGGQSLARGTGFTDNVIWNYLDNPQGLPRPSHLYWLPLPSLVAAGGYALFGDNYHAAQAPFVLLSALVPAVAYALCQALGGGRRQAWTAAGLALCSGYYVIYWGVPEAFAPYALCGALALAASGLALERGDVRWAVLAGVCTALGNLARADGVLLLVPLVLGGVYRLARPTEGVGRRMALTILAGAALGYVLAMAPWWTRNLQALGQIMPAAGTATLWLRSYDEIFSYGTLPTFASYWAWGIGNILQSKWNALVVNVATLIGVNLLVIYTPFVVVALKRWGRHALVWPALVYALLLYAAMTFAFTFPGARGGVLHSSVAFMPVLWALVPLGVDASVVWIAQRRRAWRVADAQRVFALGVVVLAGAVSAWLYARAVLGAGGLAAPNWNESDAHYTRVGAWLAEQGAGGAIVMVNNPPMFTYRTGVASIVIPNEDLAVVTAVAQRYHARYLVLDSGRPRPLAEVYAGTAPMTGWRVVDTFTDAHGETVTLLALEAP